MIWTIVFTGPSVFAGANFSIHKIYNIMHSFLFGPTSARHFPRVEHNTMTPCNQTDFI